jgi:hypothetical protein
MQILIERLAEEIAMRIRPAIPLSIDLWDAETIGAYLKKSSRQVRERYAPLPGFPQAIRLPSGGAEKSHPLWKALEVIKWAEKYQEKRPA